MPARIMISKTMQDAIHEKDAARIHNCFYTILLFDPGFSTKKFDETLEYVQSLHIPGVMQQYNRKPFRDEVTEAYWNELASELVDNFCTERIFHLKKIGRRLYPPKAQDNKVSEKTVPEEKASWRTRANRNKAKSDTRSSGERENNHSFRNSLKRSRK